MQAALIIGLSGACRSDKLFKMKKADIYVLENKISITIPSSKTYVLRTFAVTNTQWTSILKTYIEMNKDNKMDRFFYQTRVEKITKQLFGHNYIAQFPKK